VIARYARQCKAYTLSAALEAHHMVPESQTSPEIPIHRKIVCSYRKADEAGRTHPKGALAEGPRVATFLFLGMKSTSRNGNEICCSFWVALVCSNIVLDRLGRPGDLQVALPRHLRRCSSTRATSCSALARCAAHNNPNDGRKSKTTNRRSLARALHNRKRSRDTNPARCQTGTKSM
jgi:hypothetical protein